MHYTSVKLHSIDLLLNHSICDRDHRQRFKSIHLHQIWHNQKSE